MENNLLDRFDEYPAVNLYSLSYLPNEVHEGRIDILPKGGFRVGLDLRFKNYKLLAFPGPEVVEFGRAEHLPLHFHVYSPLGELIINCGDFSERSDRKIPKDLRKHLEKNKDLIEKRVEKMFFNGSLD